MDIEKEKRHAVIHRITWVFVFSVAMGLLESAVVVYLREIYYPHGFGFPLARLDLHIALTEVAREAATMIMLIGIGVLSGKSRIERFAYFLFSFAVWDIFYYVFLKVILHWPESLLTWDILFLIPVMWVGPVLAPVLLAVSMIVLALALLRGEERGQGVALTKAEWALLITGSSVALVSFTWDYVRYMAEHTGWAGMFSLDLHTTEIRSGYIPEVFPWWVFLTGQILILAGILLRICRLRGKQESL